MRLFVKLLPDECLPRKLKGTLLGHEVKTVPEMGWAGVESGELLPLIEAVFNAFITIGCKNSFHPSSSMGADGGTIRSRATDRRV